MMTKRGMTLIEVLIAAMILATVLTGMAMFQTVALKQSSKEKDRAFAMQKGLQIMEEVLAFQVTVGTDPTLGVDTLSDGENYQFRLTIDPRVSDPKMALSGNAADRDGYRFVRQISVDPVPNEKSARRVTVQVFYSDGGANPQPLSGKNALASVVNIVKAGSVKSQPTQVYDLFVIGIENVSGNRYTLEQMIVNTLDQVKANNPGLDFRMHYVRRLAYGRDPNYAPAFNTAGLLYNYSGYNPSYLGGQQIKGGGRINAIAKGNSTAHYYEQQANYAFADQFNNAVRYPEEQDKYYTTGGEISLRMLLEEMSVGRLKNAILMNMHEETIPMPPMRNYSDAAKVPRYMGEKNYIKGHYGLDPGNDTKIDDGSRARLVTHPRRLAVARNTSGNFAPGSTVELRVFPYLSRAHGTEPPAEYRKAQIVLRNLRDRIYEWNDSTSYKNVQIEVLHKVPTAVVASDTINHVHLNMETHHGRSSHGGWAMFGGLGYHDHTVTSVTTPAGYHWYRIWPTDDGLGNAGDAPYSSAIRDLYLENINSYDADGGKDIREDDIIIKLKNVPYTHAPVGDFGLPLATLFHGFNYFPDPLLPTMNDNRPDANAPRNTARFRIRFNVKDAGRYDVLTTIGDKDKLQEHQFPNRSTTYQWVDTPVPNSEQHQYIGDPRANPYEDARTTSAAVSPGQANRYFADLTTNAYYTGGAYEWNKFAGTAAGWGPAGSDNDSDLPRYFELWRRALLNANGIFQNPIGFSMWAYGKGYDTAPIMEKTDDTWQATPWLGELHPDDAWESWFNQGNLPTSGYRNVAASSGKSWMGNGAANGNFSNQVWDKGCVSFFNGGANGDASNWFTHYYSSLSSTINPVGEAMSQTYKLSLDPTFTAMRAFKINATDMNPPPDYGSAESIGWRTKLQWGLKGATTGYYTIDNVTQAAAPFVLRRTEGGIEKVGYSVLVGGHWASYTGSTLLARLCVATAMQTFFDMAQPQFSDSTARGHLATKLLPRVAMTQPAEESQLTTSDVDLTWETAWSRWDSGEYSTFFTNSAYGLSAYKPALAYHVKYSTDGGATWRFANGRGATKRGAYDPARALTGNTHRWDVRGLLNNREYQVRVECFRSASGYADAHYAYHQVPYVMARP